MSEKFNLRLIILFPLFLGIAFVLLTPKTNADQADSLLSVSNVLPVASSVSIDGGATAIDLVENDTKTVTATFTVTDNNGCSDIDSHATLDTKAVFYRTNISGGAGCTPDDENCYTMVCVKDVGTCTAGGADLTATYTCTSEVQYFADPTDVGSTYEATDWTATAIPRDNAGTDGTTASDTIEMNTLTAIDVTATINYGTLALGADTGTTDQTTIVTNTGSNQLDIQLDGYGFSDGDGFSMVCTIGNVTVGNERYSLAASTAWSAKTQLTDTAFTLTSFDLDPALTKGIYWGLGLPATGAGGSCTGKVNFTPVSG